MLNHRPVVTRFASFAPAALALALAGSPAAAQVDVSDELAMERPIPALNTKAQTQINLLVLLLQSLRNSTRNENLRKRRDT